MNAPTSISTTLRDIIGTLDLFGRNTSDYPFGIGYRTNKWWVYIEVNSANGTFDLETSAIDLHDALIIALRRIKREATLKHLLAA